MWLSLGRSSPFNYPIFVFFHPGPFRSLPRSHPLPGPTRFFFLRELPTAARGQSPREPHSPSPCRGSCHAGVGGSRFSDTTPPIPVSPPRALGSIRAP